MTNYGIGYFATIFPGGSGAVNRRRRGNRPPRKWLNINAFGLERGTMPLLDPNQLNGILFVCWQPLISVAFLKVSSCANALGRTVKHSRGGHKRCSNRLSAENIYLWFSPVVRVGSRGLCCTNEVAKCRHPVAILWGGPAWQINHAAKYNLIHLRASCSCGNVAYV